MQRDRIDAHGPPAGTSRDAWRAAWCRHASLVWAITTLLVLLGALHADGQLERRRAREAAGVSLARARRFGAWLAAERRRFLSVTRELATRPDSAGALAARPGSRAQLWLAASKCGAEACRLTDGAGRPALAVGAVEHLAATAVDVPAATLGFSRGELWISAAAPVGDSGGILWLARRLSAGELNAAALRTAGAEAAVLPQTLILTRSELACVAAADRHRLAEQVARRVESSSSDDPRPRVYLQYVGRDGTLAGALVLALNGAPPAGDPRAALAALALLLCLGLWTATSLLPPFRDVLAETRASRRRAQQSRAAYPLTAEAADALTHHLQNAASVVVLNARLLMAECDSDYHQQCLRDMLRAARQSARLIRRLQRAVTRQPVREPTAVDLEAAAATALNRLARRYRVDRVHLGDSLRGLTVRALIDDVVSIVALLIENAIEATAAGGRVDLAARLDGDWVELKVRDDGEGMTAEVAARASEPFFSARGPRHAGIGLSAVDGMVERHGGTWWIESAPGAGCCVTVRLPAWREQG